MISKCVLIFSIINRGRGFLLLDDVYEVEIANLSLFFSLYIYFLILKSNNSVIPLILLKTLVNLLKSYLFLKLILET